MSIRTRKNLDEAAKAINVRLGATMSNKEAFEHHLSAEWAKFQQFMDTDRTEEEKAIALTPVRNAISLINDELRMERLEELAKIAFKDAFLDYLKTQCVKGYRLKVTSDSADLDNQADIVLDAYDFVSALYGADFDGVVDACCIFVDNVARFALSDSAAVSKNSMHQSYLDLRERKGWNVDKSKLSKTVLAEQLTELAKMISCGVAPKMLNADVTYVMNGVIQSKDVADSAGKFVKRDERTVVRYVFRALYTRYNNLAYEFQDTTRSDKAALTVKPNKDMAEAPAQKNATPDAGNVTVTAPKKSGKTTKKTGKKAANKADVEAQIVADLTAEQA